MLGGLFAALRIAVSVRQIARELKRSNDLAELQLELTHPAWHKSGGLNRKQTKGGTPKLAHIGVMDVEAINKAWHEQHPDSDE